jgi:hypothetical protein
MHGSPLAIALFPLSLLAIVCPSLLAIVSSKSVAGNFRLLAQHAPCHRQQGQERHSRGSSSDSGSSDSDTAAVRVRVRNGCITISHPGFFDRRLHLCNDAQTDGSSRRFFRAVTRLRCRLSFVPAASLFDHAEQVGLTAPTPSFSMRTSSTSSTSSMNSAGSTSRSRGSTSDKCRWLFAPATSLT